jgi:glycosyltransferase involved in cell wall biosynthesis
MRILQVTSHYPPQHTGGAERCVRSLARALVAEDHVAHVAAGGGPPPSDDGVTVSGLPVVRNRVAAKLLFDYWSPRATAAFNETLDAFRPEVVHVHNVYGLGSAIVAASARRVPTVVTLHDYWPMDVAAPRYERGRLRYPRRPMHTALTSVHRRVHGRHVRDARLVAPSAFLGGRVGASLGCRINVIPNGVDLADHPTSGERSILYVGRLVADKGIAFALPVIADAARAAGWRVEVAGDGPLRPALERAHPEVRFHGAVADPATLLSSASILVVPSLWPENAPLAVLEGMSHGLTVVASASGGIPEYVRDGETGLLFAPGDADSLRTQISRPIADGELRVRIGSSARRDAATRGWRGVARQYVALYEELLSGASHMPIVVTPSRRVA